MEVGTNIRKIRGLKGFSQEFMSQQLELSQRQFSRIENDETDVSLSKLERIGEILEVSLTQILGFDERFIFQNCENAFGTNQNYYAFSEKEREQYEKRITHLEGEIVFLRNQLERK
jgi:transcriptional regulator with XRE-family HTH domain